MNKFTGVGVALVTPFDDDLNIDFPALKKLIDYTIDGGVDFLVTMGTTGETPTLTTEEKDNLLAKTKEYCNSRVPIVMGIGGNNTSEVVKDVKKYSGQGIDAILSVCPYYNKPSQDGMYDHFSAIAEATDLPVILYNVPGRTGSSIDPSTVIKLANQHKNIIGIKEASANMQNIMLIIQGAPEGFVVLSGDDDLVLAQVALGMQGVISVAANSYPQKFCNMVHMAMDGNMEDARRDHYELIDAIWDLFAEGNPSGVKFVLYRKSICQNKLRLPLVPISQNLELKIERDGLGLQ